MQIKPQSLPDRWYAYWILKGGKPNQTASGENLCHFVRVLLFWAPIRWFFFARTCRVVTPWSVTLFLAWLILLIAYPTSRVIALMAVLYFGVIIGFVALYEKIMERRSTGRSAYKQGKFKGKFSRGLSELFEVIKEFYDQRIHERVCPFVKFHPNSITVTVTRKR